MKWLLVTVLCLAVLGFAAIPTLVGSQTVSWRQRLTVIVDTPNSEVQGSAVTEVRLSDDRGALQLPESAGVHARFTGEAVVVEVVPGRYLFVLLDGGTGWQSDAAHWAYAAFDLAPSNSTDFRDSMAKLKAQPLNNPVPLPPIAFPLLVTFADITRPETVQKVDPQNLAATFGPGVSLKGVTLEVTREPVTARKVEGVLGWLNDPKFRTNPIWASLSELTQDAITNLETPVQGLIP